MKLNIINNAHGPESKAWYTLRPLQAYHVPNGIPTMWGLRLTNHRRARECRKANKPWLFCDMPYWGRWNPLKEAVAPDAEYYWRTIFNDIHVTKIHDNLPQDRIKDITENIVKLIPTLIEKKIDLFSSKVNQNLNGI